MSAKTAEREKRKRKRERERKKKLDNYRTLDDPLDFVTASVVAGFLKGIIFGFAGLYRTSQRRRSSPCSEYIIVHKAYSSAVAQYNIYIMEFFFSIP